MIWGLQHIFTWFRNNAATNWGLKIPGLNFNVMFNTVLQSKKKGKIQELTKRMADGWFRRSKEMVATLPDSKEDCEGWSDRGRDINVRRGCQGLASDWCPQGNPGCMSSMFTCMVPAVNTTQDQLPTIGAKLS